MNILCTFAHPDDETILTGGTLALLSAHGVHIHYVCATRGEGGELGEPPVTREMLGEVRERELVCAVGALGGKSLTFLGYLDPAIGPGEELSAFAADPTTLAGQITASIKQHQADVVLTHGSNGEYGHPAHVLMHAMTRVAVESLSENAPSRDGAPLLYTFAATFPDHPRPRLANPDDPAHLTLDISAALDQKAAAALCHKTQNPLFVRRSSAEAGRQLTVREALMTVESLRRQWPPVEGEPDDEFVRMLLSVGASRV